MLKFKRILSDNTPFITLVAMLVLAGFLSEHFYSGDNITNLLRQSVPLGLASLGLLFVILTGGIDLSIGSIMALTSVVVGLAIPEFGLTGGILLGLFVGLVSGLGSGVLVAWFGIAPFIATLAFMTITRGAGLIVSKGQPVFIEVESFNDFGISSFLGVPGPVYVLLAVFLLCVFVARKTVFGRVVLATGSNETAVRFSGIRVAPYKAAVYAISGLAAAAAGIISASRTGVGSPVLAMGFELDVIAAVVVGGARLSGGRGTVLNTLIGVIILSAISNLMNLMNIPGYHQQVVKGVIIIFAVLLEGLRTRLTARA
jgi:ribose transport system permease protein